MRRQMPPATGPTTGGVLELAREAEERRFVAEAADEVKADGKALGRLEERHRHGRCPVTLKTGCRG